MYDVTKVETYQNAVQWVNDVRESMVIEPGIVLFGNKVDNVKNNPQRRQVTKAEASQFAQE